MIENYSITADWPIEANSFLFDASFTFHKLSWLQNHVSVVPLLIYYFQLQRS